MRKYNFMLLLLTFHLCSFEQTIRTEKIPRQPFVKYVKKYGHRDSATFYLSETSVKTSLPLVIFIQGSGNTSLYAEDKGRITPQFGHMTWYDVCNNRYRVLVIEKPGVNYLQQDIENPKFDKEFSLENWSNLIIETITYILKTESIDKSKIMIAGHSEGGVVAATVANKLNGIITHVTILAGEGPTQLYSLYRFAEEGVFFNKGGFSSQQRIDSLENSWKKIQNEPLETNKKFWGFTYLRWSSFLKTSVLEQLTGFTGRIMIMQCTNDKNVSPESAKILYSSLLSKTKDVVLQMIAGADHSFHIESNNDIDGWKMVIEKDIGWFLN